MTKTLSEKIWDAHLVRREEGKPDLLYIDLHLVHEVTSAQAFEGLRLAGRKVRRPGPDAGDGRPQRADTRPRQAVGGSAFGEAGRDDAATTPRSSACRTSA